MLEFEDGTKQMVPRGDHEAHRPKAADLWPRMVTSMSRAAPKPARSERRRYMADKLESIEIFPGDNGGHRVSHNFKREVGKKGGAMLNRLRAPISGSILTRA